MTDLYRNWNGGRIETGVVITKYYASKPGMIFLGTVSNGSFTQAQHCPAHLAPTANELRYYGVA